MTPGNRHRTAIPRTAFRAFVTVLAALFQELSVCCHAIIAMPCITSVCDHYSRNMRWHSAFVTVVTTLFQEMDTPAMLHAAAAAAAVCDQGLLCSRK